MTNTVRRFVVLIGEDDHTPQGWYAYVESFDTREEATQYLSLLPESANDWWQILDLKSGDLQLGRFNK